MKKVEDDPLKHAYRNALLLSSPPHRLIAQFEALGLGRWWGGFQDRWDWDYRAVAKLSEDTAQQYLRWINS